MVTLQNPNIPVETQPIEIDAVVQDIQTKLDTNLSWLSHAYARSYRHVERKDGKYLYFPEVYIGKKGAKKYDYHRVTPDNDKKGMCFFVIGKEDNDFTQNDFNYLSYDLGIVFWVNLQKINDTLLETEKFTQHLIRDVREVLTRKMNGVWYQLKIDTVVREFQEIYREFSLEETENYLMAPYSGFRFNCKIMLQEDCPINLDRNNAIVNNISQNEVLQLLLPTLDFSNDTIFNALSDQQKTDLLNKLQ
ncbi:hypothetical protein PL373_13605 [Tenacibaculum maritimum]|nr:hypothetical protein [Tenacibaculum maritimum]MDB0602165.1 hypothetical protein [Tenacibaculum maritimum]MDB0613841.1 hypothetical protein [Tenacibaculum maritimum]